MRDRVAVLYQHAPAPPIDGIVKPMKPGGYRDSSADIAYCLRESGLEVCLPSRSLPDPQQELDWCFPDNVEGIQQTLQEQANVLWANTVLHDSHPLLTIQADIRVVGQNPFRVQRFEDKLATNRLLRQSGLPVARSIAIPCRKRDDLINKGDVTTELQQLPFAFPLVMKPIRGRGSQGVSVVNDPEELADQLQEFAADTVLTERGLLPKYGEFLLLEEYLPGQEVTVTVLPPGHYWQQGQTRSFSQPWALPVVERTQHEHGVMPYSGLVPVTQNSHVLPESEQQHPAMQQLRQHCERAAEIVGASAPLRIDARADGSGQFHLFDLNMKPNMTGAGRPGRDGEDSLVALAARAVGWSYADLLVQLVRNAIPLMDFQQRLA